MVTTTSIIDDAKRKVKIEQTIRDFLQMLVGNKHDLEDGLVA